MAAKLSGGLLRLASVVVHPDPFKNNEPGPSNVCAFEPLHIVLKSLSPAKPPGIAVQSASSIHFFMAGTQVPLFVWTYSHIRGADTKRKSQYWALQRAARHHKMQSVM
jgi:hypothetical protein